MINSISICCQNLIEGSKSGRIKNTEIAVVFCVFIVLVPGCGESYNENVSYEDSIGADDVAERVGVIRDCFHDPKQGEYESGWEYNERISVRRQKCSEISSFIIKDHWSLDYDPNNQKLSIPDLEVLLGADYDFLGGNPLRGLAKFDGQPTPPTLRDYKEQLTRHCNPTRDCEVFIQEDCAVSEANVFDPRIRAATILGTCTSFFKVTIKDYISPEYYTEDLFSYEFMYNLSHPDGVEFSVSLPDAKEISKNESKLEFEASVEYLTQARVLRVKSLTFYSESGAQMIAFVD